MSPFGWILLGVALVVCGIIILFLNGTDAEHENPNREITPMRDQWPISMFYGKDWNYWSVTALMCILMGFAVQTVVLALNA